MFEVEPFTSVPCRDILHVKLKRDYLKYLFKK